MLVAGRVFLFLGACSYQAGVFFTWMVALKPVRWPTGFPKVSEAQVWVKQVDRPTAVRGQPM